jgi:hypothetical protein
MLFLPIGGVLWAAGSVAGEVFGYGGDEAHTTANQLASSASPATTELTRCHHRLEAARTSRERKLADRR